jgi:hypothetical protein
MGIGAWGCAQGVGDPGALGFGGAVVGGETSADDDASDDADDDDDDQSSDGDSTSGASGLDTGNATTGGTLPPPATSDAPPGTSGPPPATTGGFDPGEDSGLPEVGSTGSPLGDTGFGTGGTGALGDPCTQNSDCNSNICVDAGFAIYCSQQCLDAQDCPPGWLCVATTTPGLDVCY